MYLCKPWWLIMKPCQGALVALDMTVYFRPWWLLLCQWQLAVLEPVLLTFYLQLQSWETLIYKKQPITMKQWKGPKKYANVQPISGEAPCNVLMVLSKRDQSIFRRTCWSVLGIVQQSLRVPILFRVLQELLIPLSTVMILKPEHVARKKKKGTMFVVGWDIQKMF